VHDAGRTPEKQLPEDHGQRAAMADFDGDGDLDLYLVQGGPLPVPGQPEVRERPSNRLFLNDGSAHFTDATGARATARSAATAWAPWRATSTATATSTSTSRTSGPTCCSSTTGTRASPTAPRRRAWADDRWTTAATFFDADGDGDLDLYVTGYVQIDLEHPLWCGDRKPGWRSYCHPDAYAGLPARFWRNRGDGTFEEATAAAGLVTEPEHPGKAWARSPSTPTATATSTSTRPTTASRTASGSTRRRHLQPTGRSPRASGVDAQGRTEAGMGLATGDVDGDLDLDVIKTNFDDESDTLYRNDGGGLFTDVTVAAGLEAPTRLPVGFGVVLDDLDDDGDLDLVVANGHIIDNIELYHDAKTWKQLCQTYANDGAGRFTEVTAQTGALGAEPLVGRGLYAGDLDADGDVDLLLTQNGGPARLYLNQGAPPGGSPGGWASSRAWHPARRSSPRWPRAAGWRATPARRPPTWAAAADPALGPGHRPPRRACACCRPGSRGRDRGRAAPHTRRLGLRERGPRPAPARAGPRPARLLARPGDRPMAPAVLLVRVPADPVRSEDRPGGQGRGPVVQPGRLRRVPRRARTACRMLSDFVCEQVILIEAGKRGLLPTDAEVAAAYDASSPTSSRPPTAARPSAGWRTRTSSATRRRPPGCGGCRSSAPRSRWSKIIRADRDVSDERVRSASTSSSATRPSAPRSRCSFSAPTAA
jgi:hypothetical protein